MIAALHIKHLRLEHNFTQEYVSHTLDISQKTYSNLENSKSKISLDNIIILSKLYNIKTNNLIERVSPPENKVIDNLKKAKQNKIDLSEDVNLNLPFELIHQLKARIKDLNKLIDSKESRIYNLKLRIKTLEDLD